ncbi:MAG: hypothetical protein IJ325_02205 [Clostridia bacterium]|nr:hypothetical protein [Clostridia bacterium]
MKIKKFPGILIISILALLIIGIVYYVTLPPINPCSGEFWTFFFMVLIIIGAAFLLTRFLWGKITIIDRRIKFPPFIKVLLGIAALALACILLFSLISSQLFRAKTYSEMIDLREGDFAEEIPLTEYVTDIALMDSESAKIIGARTLGTLSDLVSQYTVSESYTQIAMQGVPYKVAPLEYASFFKWFQNNSSGIPGYVKVDPVNFEAEFIRLEEYITISPSAYLNSDLMRALRFAAPLDIFGSVYFEIDDNGHPYWIASVMKPYAGWFGAYDVSGVLVMDACTGETVRYALGEIPAWIDIVYNGNLICQKYDWYGMLKNGYFNSILAQTGCTVTTDDFGYKIIGDDVYVYTGVTSVSNDEANIGFIMVNSRTGEYTYYAVPGAEEYSAMAAAQGSVQQYRYTASFPSLINVDGEATYIMVLKDANGIVKMYSMVNVTNYNIVVTSETQTEVFQKYKSRLAAAGMEDKTDPDSIVEESIVVEEILYIPMDGSTTAYIRSAAGDVYKIAFDEALLLVNPGDELTVTYTAKNDITVLRSFEK